MPGEGWSIIWGAAQDYAYLTDPSGNIVGRWFANNPELSTFDPEMTQGIIDRANQGGGGGTAAGGVYGGQVIDDPFWPGAVDYFEDAWEAKVAYSQWQEDMYNQQQADDEAFYAQQMADEEAWREEQRAYNEARALASQHAGQQESWGRAVQNAPSYGADILGSLLPAYLPESVAQALYGYGKRMGTGYAPAWPGGTPLDTAQMTPTGQDWIDYLVQQGYPGYLWER